MVELFTHIIHLDFEWLFANYNDAIYVILFLVIFIETGLVIMPFLPGDSLLFTAGLFANQVNQTTGEPFLNIFLLLGLLFFAAVAGDNTNYWVGRKIGLKAVQIKFRNKRIVKQEYLDKTHAFFEKYGTKTIIMARFVPIVRTFTPFVAGIAEMKYRRFLSFDIIGGAIWIGSLTIAGYFLGQFDWIRKNIELVALGIIFISVLPILIEIIKAKRSKKRQENQ
ncbi:MAG: VTT domain-containing protein [Crocinitomicaceae bacterium]|nr:VTT domain-containing protein [Crocinitomicaceae bacterium]